MNLYDFLNLISNITRKSWANFHSIKAIETNTSQIHPVKNCQPLSPKTPTPTVTKLNAGDSPRFIKLSTQWLESRISYFLHSGYEVEKFFSFTARDLVKMNELIREHRFSEGHSIIKAKARYVPASVPEWLLETGPLVSCYSFPSACQKRRVKNINIGLIQFKFIAILVHAELTYSYSLAWSPSVSLALKA